MEVVSGHGGHVSGRDRYPWRIEDVRQYFDRPEAELKARLDERFRQAVRLAWERIPFFQQKWSGAGLRPDDIRGTDDLGKLPTTDIEDMRRSIEAAPPFGRHWVTEPLDDAPVSVMTTGGTTGFPRPVLVTRNDRDVITDIAARAWSMAGVGRGDVVQVSATYSTHGAAWIAQWGLERAGALVVPASSGAVTPTVRQLEFVRRFGVTAAYWTATYSRIVAAAAESAGIAPADLGIRRIVGLGEVISPAMRRQIEDTWQAKAYDLYGTMETMAWSSVDCEASRECGGALGMHIWSDAVLVEILDQDGSPCPPGEYGDLTFTSWVSLAGPKFRYRMGDRAALWTDPCPCGLRTPRLSPLAGRVDDMLRINGQSIWPSSIEAVLRRAAPEVGDWIAVASRSGPHDVLTLHVETADRTSDYQLPGRLATAFKAGAGVNPQVVVVEPGATAERSGAGKVLKAKRIFDER